MMTVYQLIQRLTEYPADARIVVDGDYDILSIGIDYNSDNEDAYVNLTSGLFDDSEGDDTPEEETE